MSVETDTMRYYAQISHDDAFDVATESHSQELALDAYDWLTERFGEDAAIALTDQLGVVTPADTMDAIYVGRAKFQTWLRKSAASQIITETED